MIKVLKGFAYYIYLYLHTTIISYPCHFLGHGCLFHISARLTPSHLRESSFVFTNDIDRPFKVNHPLLDDQLNICINPRNLNFKSRNALHRREGERRGTEGKTEGQQRSEGGRGSRKTRGGRSSSNGSSLIFKFSINTCPLPSLLLLHTG